MKSFNYVITDEQGVHARPAGILVKEAKNMLLRLQSAQVEKMRKLQS
ncbi:hypothetical protein C823_004297 [Eubacterium plexicaudatum ASF492]|nr:hypothetical protein C823_004297 [Eubacterium plexicaudatum ASF492]